jgi:hypothetical protein
VTTNANGTWVVAHFQDGRVLKGMTQDFAPTKPTFHLFPAHGAPSRGVTVPFEGLKAVFFVRTFDGNREHAEHDEFHVERGQGKKVLVTFTDGEVLAGFTSGYAPGKLGWFLFPADPASNNERVFILSTAVKKLEWPPASIQEALAARQRA